MPSTTPTPAHLLTPRDWQMQAIKEATALVGTSAYDAKAVEAKRYGMLADALESTQADLNQQMAMVEKCILAMNENADRGQKAEAEVARLRRVVQANHDWHLINDEYDGYHESELCGMNTATAGASPSQPKNATGQWMVIAPDGTEFTGETPLKAAFPASKYRLEIDPVAAAKFMEVINQIADEGAAEREQCMQDYGTLNCPACGGSGHIADAVATKSVAIKKLGKRLAELLDEDQFAECEKMLLAIEQIQETQPSQALELSDYQIDELVEAAIGRKYWHWSFEQQETLRKVYRAAINSKGPAS